MRVQENNKLEVNRNEIWLANLGEFQQGNSVQKGLRPCIVVSNKMNNIYSPTVIVVPLSSKINKLLPVHVLVGEDCGILKKSIALTEQTQTIDKSQLINRVGCCTNETINKVNQAILTQFNLTGQVN